MSWRRFLALCRNLSPMGAVAMRAQEAKPEPEDRDKRRAADAFFSALMRV